LFGSIRQEKIGSCVDFVLEPRRKVDKRKLDFFSRVNAWCLAHTSLFATPIATPNGHTMAK
jgi:hypothetical protein